jgi:NAD+ synthase (glutamine-hydrolysing)
VINGVSVGVSICEDIWYEEGPPSVQAKAGAELIVNINASPYHRGKGELRQRLIQTRASEYKVPVAYVNMVGGQDELIFDGQSLIFDREGALAARGPQFDESLVLYNFIAGQALSNRKESSSLYEPGTSASKGIGPVKIYHVSDFVAPDSSHLPESLVAPSLEPLAEIYAALVLGTSDYVLKSGHKKVVIGASGGIDSALTLAIAVDALGKDNVSAFFMPSRFTSDLSHHDALALAGNLGISIQTIPIDPMIEAYQTTLQPLFEGLHPDTTEENIQARIRGNILMAASNKFGWLVLNTGNKSELATGYCTLYGDMAGGFAVLKDVPKTLVRQLAQYRNELNHSVVIPLSTLSRPPTAELRPDQTDEESLLPYDLLDPILEAYVENDQSTEEIVSRGHSRSEVRHTISLVDRNEYKRRQAPPGIKITARAFGRDRRLPIINRYQA